MELRDNLEVVLRNKGRLVWSVSPDTSVFDALEEMARHDVGALPVLDDQERLVGVISERDYARKVILLGKSSRETLVREIMRHPDAIANMQTTVSEAMRLMTDARVRHLPVLEGHRVIGIVSIGDMVNWVIQQQEREIQALHAYVSGSYPA